jgi:hypothetical protein
MRAAARSRNAAASSAFPFCTPLKRVATLRHTKS